MIKTSLATLADLPEVAALLSANAATSGGTLTGEWTLDKVIPWIKDGGSIALARDGQTLAGVLLASEPGAPQGPPVIALLKVYRGSPDAYVYGPTCVSTTHRGRGILQALYDEIRKHYPGREAILFIRADNTASIRAHRKLGMREVGKFWFADNNHLILSDRRAPWGKMRQASCA